jgi:hypothetical protein
MWNGVLVTAAALLVLSARPLQQSPPALRGTTWAASYYYYHEEWTFLGADSVAIASGQWGWAMGLDPAQGLSEDSLYFWGTYVHAYTRQGPWLIIDPLNDPDTLTWTGEMYVSNWEYAYGRVGLVLGGDDNCKMHAPVR